MVEVRKNLMSNTSYLLIGWIGSIILNFLFQMIAAKTLLPDELGVLSTAISFAAILSSVLVFGMEQTTQKLASFYLGKNKIEYISSVLWFFFLLTIFLNVIVISGLLLFSTDVSQAIKIPRNILFISIFALLPLSVSFFLAGILRGYQNMRYLTTTAIFGDLLKVIVAGSLVVIGYKVYGFMIGYLIGVVSILLLRISNIRRFISKFKIPSTNIITKYAVPSFITQIFWLILLSGQYIIITILQNPYATGLFTVAMILSNQIYFVPRIISDALFPITSRLSANRMFFKQQCYLLNIALRYSFLFSLPILFFVSIFPIPLIFLIGQPLFFPAAELVPILVTASLFFGVATLLSRTLYAIGKTMTFQTISIVFTIFYIITSVILTISYSALGTAIAYLITTLLMTVVSLYYLKKYISFRIEYIPLVKIFMGSFITFSLLYLISFRTPSLIAGAVLTMLFTILYFLMLYFMKFYNDNDLKILDFISERVPFAAKYVVRLKNLLSEKIKRQSENNDQRNQ